MNSGEQNENMYEYLKDIDMTSYYKAAIEKSFFGYQLIPVSDKTELPMDDLQGCSVFGVRGEKTGIIYIVQSENAFREFCEILDGQRELKLYSDNDILEDGIFA